MPPRRWIDKKTAQHFTLVHRPQNDPLIHDESAPSMVLNPTDRPNAYKSKKLDDLASELGSDAEHIRDNEGEAANYGVYYDDSEYDYMQHLRDLGDGSQGGEVVFVEATGSKNKEKGKQKESLEDALKQLDIEETQRKREDGLGDDFLPSKNLQRKTYQDQQDIPDVIGGFQPDMDPRLREVLEALEDDAYVDDEDDDIFQELAKDGTELNEQDFEERFGDGFDDDDGWESDDTAKPIKEYKTDEAPELVPVEGANGEQDAVGPSSEWMENFKEFKKDQKAQKQKVVAPSRSGLESSIMTTTTNGGRRKKRKGALTNPSTYSMTSSALVRTEQMSILDARFDKIEEEYNGDMDDMSDMASMSAVSTASSVQGPLRKDFDGILDDFLGDYSMHGKKQMKKGNWKNGAAQLDEIRRELGPARVKSKYR